MNSKKYNTYQRNPKKIYDGSHYAITGKGGFSIKESYAMKLEPIRQLGKYDMTNAVQILFPAELLNGLLGGFNEMTKEFNNNQIIITADQLLNTVQKEDILSVGAFDSMYYDYQNYINNYFGFTLNGVSLFTNESQIEFNNGVFNKNCLYSVLHEKRICSFSGEIKDALNGYIEIKDISEMLYKINELDLFGNRPMQSSSHDICKGFIDGDLIYISDGIHIKLDTEMTIDSAIIPILENRFNKKNGNMNIKLDKGYHTSLLLRLI